MTIRIVPSQVASMLGGIAALLTVIHSAVLIRYYQVGDPHQFDFIQLVDLDYEGNLPTLFAVFLLLLSATLFYLIARQYQAQQRPAPQHNDSTYWLGLALIFLYLAVDEGARLHEQIGDVVETWLPARGYLYFPWVIPYSIVVALLGLSYWPFYTRLPKPTQRGLGLAAVVFLSGAVGLDVVSAYEADTHSTRSLRYSVLYTIEEVLEMLGVICLIYTLLRHLEQLGGRVIIDITSTTAAHPRTNRNAPEAIR